MQATAKRIRKIAVKRGAPKKQKRNVYADSFFTKKHTMSRAKMQKGHEE